MDLTCEVVVGRGGDDLGPRLLRCDKPARLRAMKIVCDDCWPKIESVFMDNKVYAAERRRLDHALAA